MDKQKKHLAGKRPVIRPGLNHDRTPPERSKPTPWEIMHGWKQADVGAVEPKRPRKRGLLSRLR